MSPAVPLLPSYASGTSDVPLLGETIGDNFDRMVAADPDREALVEVPTGQRWSYAQLRADVDALALGLLGDGVAKGDRVGIWAPNMAEWTLLQYATAKIGAILVNINPSYRTHELEYVLRQAGISLLVSARAFKTSDYAAMIEQVRGNCPELRAVVLIGSAEWDGLLATGRRGDPADLAARQAALSPDEPINIQYTSGTTGFPKGATLSHHNILNNGYFVGRLCRYTPDDRVLHPGAVLPLLRHGDGQPGCHHERLHHGHPGPGVRPQGHPGGRGPGAVHLPVRRADHVHRRAQPPGLRLL